LSEVTDELLDLVAAGDVQSVAELLTATPELRDREGHHGYTALTLACARGQMAVVERILQFGANPNAGLCFAAEHGHLGVVELLMANGADPKPRTDHASPLECAVCFDHTHHEIAEALRSAGAEASVYSCVALGDLVGLRSVVSAEPAVLRATSSPVGKLPLHLAISKRQVEVAEFLIQAGADCRGHTTNEQRPLPLAVSFGLSSVVEMLRARLASLNALELLALEEFEAARNLLCENGQLRGELVSGEHLVHLCVLNGLRPGLHWLIEHGAPLDSRAPADFADYEPYTPLAFAILSHNVEMVRALLEAGADPNVDLGGNMLATHLAAMRGNLQVIQLVADAGGDFLRRDDTNGAPPLGWARYNRHPEAAVLIERLVAPRAD